MQNKLSAYNYEVAKLFMKSYDRVSNSVCGHGKVTYSFHHRPTKSKINLWYRKETGKAINQKD